MGTNLKTIFFIFILFSPFYLGAYKYEDNIEEHFRYGYELFKANRLDEAEVEFRNLILINPDLALGYLWLGKVLQKKGLLQDAINFWKKGLEIEPENKELKKLLTLHGGAIAVKDSASKNRKKEKNVPSGFIEVDHKIKPGDTLKKLALYYFGDEGLADKIAAYNGIDYLGELKEGSVLKILVSEARWKKLQSSSEKLEKLYLEKEKRGKPVGEGTSFQLAQKDKSKPHKVIVIDTSSIENKPEEENQQIQTIPASELSKTTPTNSPKTQTQTELEQDSAENSLEISSEVDNLVEICNSNKKKIEEAVLNYNLDHIEEMNKGNFSLEVLKKEGYLKSIPLCPENGEYYMDEEGKVKCSFHD